MIPVLSSFIHAIGYDPDHRTVTVEFKRGSVYQYAGVSAHTFSRWLKAQSKGVYYHRNIRNRFACKRIA